MEEKKAQVDITKELPSEKFKTPGAVEKLNYNPKPGAYDVSTNVQQETDTKIGLEHKMYAPKIPASAIGPVKATINWFKKKADDVTGSKTEDAGSTQYRAQGDKEKLQYPTKADAMPSVKQPGLEKSEDPNSKQFKSPGAVEKLEVPTGMAAMPKVDIVVDVDKKIGSGYKDEGEKEKLSINPKTQTVSVSQEKVKIEIPRAGEEKAGPMQKQFSQINWMKRKATSEEAQEWISNKIKLLVGEGKDQDQASAIAYSMAREKGYDVPEKKASQGITPERKAQLLDTLLRFAAECPDCFKNLVLEVAEGKDLAAPKPVEKQAMTKEEAARKATEMTTANPDKAYVASPVTEGSTEFTVVETKKASQNVDILVEQEKAIEEQLLKDLAEKK